MKILFYETKDFEFNYLSDKIPDNIEPYFFRIPLINSTYIDEYHQDAEALCVFVASVLNEEILSKFKNLKFIFLRCTGYSNVDLKYCKDYNIKVFNTPDYGSSTVAEYAFALLLNISKKILKAKKDLDEGEIDYDEIMGIELANKTLGIIGLGAIGRKVAKIAQGFNMDIIVNDINEQNNYNYVCLDELYLQSDFIIITCPLTPQTKGMINRNAFLKMKKDLILVNVARGEIINTKDLATALVEKRIQGAALDVIECEETLCALWDFCLNTDSRNHCLKKFLFIQKLKQMDNVIITPHNAYNTKEANKRILNMTLENIQSSFNIKPDTKNLIMI